MRQHDVRLAQRAALAPLLQRPVQDGRAAPAQRGLLLPIQQHQQWRLRLQIMFSADVIILKRV